MRVWDIPCSKLCRQHLLGEHRELHAIWAILTNPDSKSPYRNHPETKRWKNHLRRLYKRHSEQVEEMINRGYNHDSDLKPIKAFCAMIYPFTQWQTTGEQIKILKAKGCECKI